MKTVTEYTIREVEENGQCRVQYISEGEVLLEGKEYPYNKYGHPYFSKMVQDSLLRIKEVRNEVRKDKVGSC